MPPRAGLSFTELPVGWRWADGLGGHGARSESEGRTPGPTPTPRKALRNLGQTPGPLRAGAVAHWGACGWKGAHPAPVPCAGVTSGRRGKPEEGELEGKDTRYRHRQHREDPGEGSIPRRPPRFCPATGPARPTPAARGCEGEDGTCD